METSTYTRERLEAAARGARTLTEALQRLGGDPRSGSRRYLLDRMRKPGVETSHFEREGVRWTREVLAEAVGASTNMYEVLGRLGVEAVGGQHTHISRRVRAYGIDTAHFTPPARTESMRLNHLRRTPAEILVEDTSPHVPGASQASVSKRRCRNPASRTGALCAEVARCGEAGPSRWKSTTSTATGGTTRSATCASSAPTAMR